MFSCLQQSSIKKDATIREKIFSLPGDVLHERRGHNFFEMCGNHEPEKSLGRHFSNGQSLLLLELKACTINVLMSQLFKVIPVIMKNRSSLMDFGRFSSSEYSKSEHILLLN